MCLTLGQLKCMVEIEVWIILLSGMGAFLYTIILQMEYYDYQMVVDVNTSIFGQGLLNAFWIITPCVVLNGLFWVGGEKDKIRCLLFLFHICNMVLFLAFLVLMTFGYVWAGEIGNYNKNEKCANSNPIVNPVQVWGQQQLCSSTCQCYYNQQASLPLANRNYSRTNPSLPTSVQQCLEFKNLNGNYTHYGHILAGIEKQFLCTGWCDQYSVMVFYDINIHDQSNTNYSNTCLDVVYNRLQDMGMLMGYISAGLMGLMGIMVIFTLCLCFHPTKQDMEYYKRLAY